MKLAEPIVVGILLVLATDHLATAQQNRVRVRVRAASVNALDWHTVHGEEERQAKNAPGQERLLRDASC